MKAAARVFAVVAAVGVGVHLAFALAGRTGGAPVEDWLYAALFAVTSASCAWRALRDGEERVPWALASLGVAVWGLAEVIPPPPTRRPPAGSWR
jgi:hypothetical protein